MSVYIHQINSMQSTVTRNTDEHTCHITDIYIDPTLWQISIKNQYTATFICYFVAKYVPLTNTQLKCQKYGIFPNYATCIYKGSTPISIPHMTLLPLMM